MPGFISGRLIASQAGRSVATMVANAVVIQVGSFMQDSSVNLESSLRHPELALIILAPANLRMFTVQDITPRDAYVFLKEQAEAVLVDCRTEIEFMYVGHPVGAEHVAWQEGPDWAIDPEFSDKVKRLVKGDLKRPVLLICRSGQRSVYAAEALEDAGFSKVINVLEGFEGPLNERFHRGTLGGWRYYGLPWQQS